MSYPNELTERLYVALDYGSLDDALRLVDRLGGSIRSYKIGMQLFYKEGPKAVERLHRDGCSIFLDLKFHDIPATVAGAVKSLSELGVSMVNVHAAGGLLMMQQAIETAKAVSHQVSSQSGVQAGGSRPLVIAVTQLTSTTQAAMNEQQGIPGTMESSVVRYAKLAQQAGLDGVVASGQEIEAIRQACGSDFITVIPGIRPEWAANDDQQRILTPATALQKGAHRLVIGRPITHAADPKQAADRILEEMGEALA